MAGDLVIQLNRLEQRFTVGSFGVFCEGQVDQAVWGQGLIWDKGQRSLVLPAELTADSWFSLERCLHRVLIHSLVKIKGQGIFKSDQATINGFSLNQIWGILLLSQCNIRKFSLRRRRIGWRFFIGQAAGS